MSAAASVDLPAGGLRLSPNARAVLERRYLRKDEDGRVVETPEQMFRRVAHAVAEADRAHEGEGGAARMEEAYYKAMTGLLFLPNSPTLMNAGTRLGQLAACFVLPVGDSIPEIFDAVRNMALVHQSGGGTGFSFSRLRPEGDVVHETGGVASGPVSFMRVFDTATEVVKQGGRRRGANMGVLRVDHPDIERFVAAKETQDALTNFNLSVAVPDAFMHALHQDALWELVNPRTARVTHTIPARRIWSLLCEAAWRTGDPGVLFIDEINRCNPTPALGQIEATNPCGEQPLLPFEACNLGSINLAPFARPAGFDWQGLDETARLAVRFLDNVIDAGSYPLPEIARISLANRKIGLGVMGLAEALILLDIPYASERAVAFASHVMERISEVAREASAALARQRGSFPNFEASTWPRRGYDAMRNASLTTIAPTGTLSIIAGTSSGIEPLFAVAYYRTVLEGTEMAEVSPLFVDALEKHGLPVEPIVEEVSRTGTIQPMRHLPLDLRRRFQTALDIAPEWHVRMQAAVQRHTDNGVSKTVNLPASATVGDVSRLFELAWKSRCKGITVFRYGCRGEQVLTFGKIPSFARTEAARAHSEYTGECRVCST
jgi:ribonucleoside-diphosphate reductase alpha chain